MRCASLVCVLLLLLTALTTQGATPTATPVTVTSVNEIAEAYVKLVLALGQHDPDYVDAYYGPPEWKTQSKKSLDVVALEARQLRDELTKIADSSDEMERLRRKHLLTELSALEARVRMLKAERISFDEESRVLYDAVAPNMPESHFQEILTQLEGKLPGEGPLQIGRASCRERVEIRAVDRPV